jgi:hypothetical protein
MMEGTRYIVSIYGNVMIRTPVYLTPVRIAIIKSTTTNKCWQECRKKEPSYTADGNAS